MEDKMARKLKFMRFGLTLVVAVAFSVTLVVFYITLAPLNALDQVFYWTAIITVAAVVLSFVVYYFYKSYFAKGS